MTIKEIGKATIEVLWTRLEALEFVADPYNQIEIHWLQTEISSRDVPWARLEASFNAAIEDEYYSSEN